MYLQNNLTDSSACLFNLNLADPKKMMEAVPANEQCGHKLATVE
jgi:hypothetical protein